MVCKAFLVLENGSIFEGKSLGAFGSTVGEVVFNTSMTGYQEILTDPSYKDQIVTLTYPHIGNTGVNSEDIESKNIHTKGLIIRDNSIIPSNFRSEDTLSNYLKTNNIIGIYDIDTRMLTRMLREKGTMTGCIMTGSLDKEKAYSLIASFPGLKGLDLAKEVTTKNSFVWTEKTWNLKSGYSYLTENNALYHIVAYDFGVKNNILRILASMNCKITVVPAQTPAETVLEMKPDGVFLSNGPGDPEPCDYAINATKIFLDKKIPIFGICLGHQILGLASGAKTFKMKFGHHGANHPIQDLSSKKVLITSQNHNFAIDPENIPLTLKVTHKSLFDQSVAGIEHTECPAFSFQGHPEASPGPQDAMYLFEKFIDLIKKNKQ